MKFLALSFLIIIAAAVIFGGFLYLQMRLVKLGPVGAMPLKTLQPGTSAPATTAPAKPKNPTSSPSFSPPVFQGPPPGDAPHVIGPSGPPPNY